MSATDHSSVSTTDVNVFKRLANPAVVDVHVQSRACRATSEMKQALEQAAHLATFTKTDESAVGGSPQGSSTSTPRTLPKSTFQKAQELAAREVSQAWSARELVCEAPVLQTATRPVCSVSSMGNRETRTPSCPGDSNSLKWERAPLSAPSESDGGDVEESKLPAAGKREKPRDDEGERLEKQGYIIELANMRQKGVELSRNFTMDDSLAEMEFEMQKQQNNTTTRQHVAFMRDMLKIGINGLEIANTRFGPFLSIDGWAESVTSDMSKYEPPLEKLYRRYYRRSQMSPIMELAWLLIGSMAAFHFKNKFFQPTDSTRSVPPSAEHSARPKPARRATPSDRFKTAAARSGRPVLRPPSSLFGM